MMTTTTGEHLSKQYDADLEGIRSRVLTMGGLVERQFQEAVHAFMNGLAEEAKQVVVTDLAVNRLEVELDDACSHLIVRRQPTANDLRTVVATLKIITDLERVGDEAVKIARHAANHLRDADHAGYDEMIARIAQTAQDMLHSALDAFARLDDQLALDLIAQDAGLDREFHNLVNNLTQALSEDNRQVARLLDMLWAARAIERIGDHAKNICEYVVYVVSARDIRHQEPTIDETRK